MWCCVPILSGICIVPGNIGPNLDITRGGKNKTGTGSTNLVATDIPNAILPEERKNDIRHTIDTFAVRGAILINNFGNLTDLQ